MEIVEIGGKKEKNRMPPEQFEELIKKKRKEADKMIKGMFEFVDAGGGWFDFNYRFFRGEPIYKIRINHGEIVELPMGIVKHLNNTKRKIRVLENENLAKVNEQGKQLPVRGVPSSVQYTSRVRFQPLEYI